MRIAFYICLSLVFLGCSSRPVPKGVMSPDEMKKVIYDLMQVDEYLANHLRPDSTVDVKQKRSIFYEQVFKMHNTSRKEFYTSFRYYQRHPDVQKILFDSLSQEANRKKNEIATKPPVLPFNVKPQPKPKT